MGAGIEAKLDPTGLRLFEYWRRLGGGSSRPPAKASFDPIEVPYALPGVQIVEKRHEDDSLYYRLVGTREVAVRGFDPTGKPVREGYFCASWEEVEGNYHIAFDKAEPLIASSKVLKRNHVMVRDISLFLPMTDDVGDVRFVLVYSYQRPVGVDAQGANDL